MGVARNDREVLQALEELDAAIEENMTRARVIQDQIAHIRAERASGRSYSEILQMVSESATNLDRVGVKLRRAEARRLYEQGHTMEQIAAMFGVTRQRVSTLLKATNG